MRTDGRDPGGTFTAHNWTEERYHRRIGLKAEDDAAMEGRPFSRWQPPASSVDPASPRLDDARHDADVVTRPSRPDSSS